MQFPVDLAGGARPPTGKRIRENSCFSLNVMLSPTACSPFKVASMAIHQHAPGAHPAAPPAFSLLRLSAFLRTLGAIAVIVPLWLAIQWALR